jgi:hypothetical protein
MFIETKVVTTEYQRSSKLGRLYTFKRKKIVAVFRCDNCVELFSRDLKHISRKRLNNNYFHCCQDCDSKRFAQKKGAERKIIWDKTVSSLDDISKL